MDIQRLLLFIALGFVLLLIWQAWQEEQAPTPATVPAPAVAPGEDVPVAPRPETTPGVAAPPAADTEVPHPALRAPLESADRITVRTDVLELAIDTAGGDLRRADLLDYPLTVGRPDEPVRLFNDTLPNLFVAETGLLPGTGTDTTAAPARYARFHPERTEYVMSADADVLRVPLHWTGPDGISITKTYTFRRGSYLVELDYEVHNGSQSDWSGYMYRELQRTDVADTPWFIYTYTGAVISSEARRYEKISFSDMRDQALGRNIRGGWAAMMQHYFLAAWVPATQDEVNHVYTRVRDGARYVLGMVTPEQAVAPGGTARFSSQLFVGPKLQDHLREAAPGLELTVDYGFLTVIAQPLYWLLERIHRVVGNWGWAIVILTLLIKLVFYKLSATSYRSMANMRRVQPRLMALKERYGTDRQRLNQALMDLYKKEKINPLGGCLPILVQIPVFIALYWVLLESVELRQADFILWINDLSNRDPFFVLPVLMGLTMFVQHKLNPAPLDPIQQKVMMILPFVFTVFFAFFPAGLVLYWLVNNTLSIAQQWYITRHIVKA